MQRLTISFVISLLGLAGHLLAQQYCGPGQGTTWCQFTTCISSQGPANGWQGTCQLPSGSYPVSSTLTIGRTVTVTGSEASDPGDTLLYRSEPYYAPVITVASGVSGVVIEDLEIHGNRDALLQCQSNAYAGIYDLDLRPGAGGNTILNVYLEYSPFSEIAMATGDSLGNSLIYEPRFWGVGMTNNDVVWSTTVTLAGANGIFTYASDNAIEFNTVTYNHIEYDLGSLQGGQIWFGTGSQSSTAFENIVTGYPNESNGGDVNGCPTPAGGTNYGFEIYGVSQSLYNNGVTSQTAMAVSIDGTNGIVISGTDPNCPSCSPNAISGNQSTGIQFHTTPSSSVTLNAIRVENNAGYGMVFIGDSGEGFTNGACLKGNNGGGGSNGGRWTGNVSNLVNQPPPTDTGCI